MGTGTNEKKILYRWVPGASEKKKLGTVENRVPARKKFLGTDGYWLPARQKKIWYRWVPGIDQISIYANPASLSYWHGLLDRNKTIDFFLDIWRRAVERLKNEVIGKFIHIFSKSTSSYIIG